METSFVPVTVTGQVTFTKKFKYLGSYISYNWSDGFDVETHIANAAVSMGSLKPYWIDPVVNFNSKYIIFSVIPLNLLLW